MSSSSVFRYLIALHHRLKTLAVTYDNCQHQLIYSHRQFHVSKRMFLKSANSNMYPITSSKTNMSAMNSKQFCSFPFSWFPSVCHFIYLRRSHVFIWRSKRLIFTDSLNHKWSLLQCEAFYCPQNIATCCAVACCLILLPARKHLINSFPWSKQNGFENV